MNKGLIFTKSLHTPTHILGECPPGDGRADVRVYVYVHALKHVYADVICIHTPMSDVHT